MTQTQRPSNRANNELRHVNFTRNYTKHAEGSVLVEFGDTKVICTASVNDNVPPFLKGKGQGWVTAEYGMLPRATNSRTNREAARGKQTGRTQEIQRLIGRSLRACVDLELLGENTIHIDCDVIQADGGTRTASITGACVALYDAINSIKGVKVEKVFKHFVAAISVGIYQSEAVLDLDYAEDSNCETDMNVVMSESNNTLEFIEVQGTAEGVPFHREELNSMLDIAAEGIESIVAMQKQALGL